MYGSGRFDSTSAARLTMGQIPCACPHRIRGKRLADDSAYRTLRIGIAILYQKLVCLYDGISGNMELLAQFARAWNCAT